MTAPDLPAFLLARYDEIDPLHGRLSDDLPHYPYCGGMALDDYDEQYEFRPDLCDCGVPARVLADCAALRAVVELHRHQAKGPGPVLFDGSRESNEGVFGCVICSCVDDDPGWHLTGGWCATLLALAQPFASHPDFNESWRVGG